MGEGQPSSESQSVPRTWDCPSTRPLKLAALPLGYRVPTNPPHLFSRLHRLWRKHILFSFKLQEPHCPLNDFLHVTNEKAPNKCFSESCIFPPLYASTCQITMTAPFVWDSFGRKRNKCLEQQKPPVVYMQWGWSFIAVYFTQSCKPHTSFDIGGVNYSHLCPKYHIAFQKPILQFTRKIIPCDLCRLTLLRISSHSCTQLLRL